MPGKVELQQHANGRWYITWTERGRSYRSSTRTTDRGEAETARATFILARDEKPEAKPAEIALSTVLDSYYERHAKGLASGERANHAINHLSEFFKGATVANVNARTLERYIAQCRAEEYAPGTINQHLTRLRAALRFAVKSGDLATAPHVPSVHEGEPQAAFLTRKQVAALLKAARHKWPHVALFVRLAIYTGARRSAILQLTWDRVDLRAGTVDFRLPGATHSRKRRAIAGLPVRLVASLRRIKKRQPGDHVIQYSNSRREDTRHKATTRPIASIKRAFGLAVKAAGIKTRVTPHTLKHTAVTWALRVASPWIVSGQTATSIRTLQRVYGKHMADDLRAAAEAVARSGMVTRKTRAKTKRKKATKKAVRGRKSAGK
jgi:integrase